MSTVEKSISVKTEPTQRLLLRGMTWGGYEKMLEALDGQHVRVTYDRGEVELMSPLPIHEAIKVWFTQLMTVVAMELEVPLKIMGSTTIRRRDLDKGLEPDDCYYLASASRVRDWATLDLNHDPPPDLVVEVDISNSSINRLGIYAALRVPEVWRYDSEGLHVLLLGSDGTYQESEVSRSLPYVPISDITELLEDGLREKGDDRPRLRAIQDWCRHRVAPLKEAWDQSQIQPT
jgi:Uma2 family endonuclease